MSTTELTLPMSVLIGDSNADAIVNAADALQTRSRAGEAVTAANFRSDVNVDAVINSGDVISVRSRSGSSISSQAEAEAIPRRGQ
jgi:hypothetical protein